MRSWNILEEKHHVTLLNGSDTKIIKHSKVPFGIITDLMSQMEELDFPIDYSEGIESIRFTYLKNELLGDYNSPGIIRLACNKQFREELHQTFVHEIGHHIDAKFSFSSSEDLILEWCKTGYLFKDKHINILSKVNEVGPSEYFAIGFELYYSHSEGLNKKQHPVLFKMLMNAENNRTK